MLTLLKGPPEEKAHLGGQPAIIDRFKSSFALAVASAICTGDEKRIKWQNHLDSSHPLPKSWGETWSPQMLHRKLASPHDRGHRAELLHAKEVRCLALAGVASSSAKAESICGQSYGPPSGPSPIHDADRRAKLLIHLAGEGHSWG
jgi:hypothetical protein